MEFSIETRTATLSVGEFAGFSLGPREAVGGPQGIWRAQLGTHWHNELRSRALAEHGPAAAFEIPITGRIVHRGWTLTLTGRIDQVIGSAGAVTLREIKSVTRTLPAAEDELRTDYPEYFIQIATYAALYRSGALAALHDGGASAEADALLPEGTRGAARAELVFVEVGTGLAQTLPLSPADDALFRTQLERISEFLALRLRSRERLRHLRFRPAFAMPRPGQETTRAELTARFEKQPLIFFEAPTGFGKTGVLLEFALGQLRAGHFDRALYLTSKSTGQLQVLRTLGVMTGAPTTESPCPPPATAGPGTSSTPAFPEGAFTPVAAWHVRNKAEHCVNTTFHCVRDNCLYLADAASRWASSGLARFYLDERHARDLDTLRAAGRDARICPYEITRAALAFNDVWIGDYNYVFAPRNRGLFFEQPGFLAARSLLIIDEAHNLPSRVADAYSHAFTASDAFAVRDELHRIRPMAALVTAWEHWCHFLQHLRATGALPAGDEDDARHLLGELAKLIAATPLDLAVLGPHAAGLLWQVPALADDLAAADLPRLWWAPREGQLAITCLDGAAAIGPALREFGGVVLASATLTPIDGFAAACGLGDWAGIDRRPENPRPGAKSRGPATAAAPEFSPPEKLGKLTKRDTRKLYRQLTNAAELLRVEEARDASRPAVLRALAPWRDATYDLVFDARVDTTFQHRSHHYATTAATIVALQDSAQRAMDAAPDALPGTSPCIAVFFPSYAYAEAIRRELEGMAAGLRVALQPRLRDLAAQTAWVEDSLRSAGALFLVLGSSFAESIDLLGGRITHAMVVGPALPEVNAVQRARLTEATRAGLARDEAFRRVYQIPGMTKVNQALGRLVRAPGQHTRVILHCRRFLDESYASLLAPEYRNATTVTDDAGLAVWLECARRAALMRPDSAL